MSALYDCYIFIEIVNIHTRWFILNKIFKTLSLPLFLVLRFILGRTVVVMMTEFESLLYLAAWSLSINPCWPLFTY